MVRECWRYNRDIAFAVVRAQTGSSLSLGSSGELTDPTTGFLDLRARDLDPSLGRFLSRDSVTPNAPGTQGYNPYAYVANNPTNWTDPTGQSISGSINGFFLLASACVLTRWCVVPLLDGVRRLGSGDWRVQAGGFAESTFAVVACALASDCQQLSQDIELVVRTYGSRITGTGGTNAPSPGVCVMGALEGVGANRAASASSPAYAVQGAIRGCIQGTSDAIGNGSGAPPPAPSSSGGGGDPVCSAAAARAEQHVIEDGLGDLKSIHLDEHHPDAGIPGVGRFNQVAWDNLEHLILEALGDTQKHDAHVNPSLTGNALCEVTYRFDAPIGTDGNRVTSSTIGIYVNENGTIRSAYPIPDQSGR